MVAPTSEVDYSPAMPRREDHEVHKGHVVALGEKKILPRTCNKDEKQQDAKYNAEILTKVMKTTWKTFEQTTRQGRSSCITAQFVTYDDELI